MAEDEELVRLKEWWRKNGTSIVVGVVIGLGAIVGVNGWDLYTTNRAETASALYFQLRQHVEAGDVDAASKIAGELQSDFAATPYAPNGALLTGGALYGEGDVDGARAMLQWTLDNADETGVVHAARLRLAYLELGAGNSARALALATVDDPGTFASHYAEIRADAHRLAGSIDQARDAYDEAIAALSAASDYANVLKAKRNGLARTN